MKHVRCYCDTKADKFWCMDEAGIEQKLRKLEVSKMRNHIVHPPKWLLYIWESNWVKQSYQYFDSCVAGAAEATDSCTGYN